MSEKKLRNKLYDIGGDYAAGKNGEQQVAKSLARTLKHFKASIPG